MLELDVGNGIHYHLNGCHKLHPIHSLSTYINAKYSCVETLNSIFHILVLTAIAQEKKEVELRTGIEGFNKENMKHSETQVKQVLPDKESKYIAFVTRLYYVKV